MKHARKALIAIGATIAVILAVLLVLPLLFKDRIAARAKTEIAQSIDAQVDWSGMGLTFFRNFPNLTFRLNDFTVRGTGRFQSDTLARVRKFRLVLDLGSVLRNLRQRGPIEVRSVVLNEPALHFIVLEDGTANWDIFKTRDPRARPDSARAFHVALRNFVIDGASLVFDNRQTHAFASLSGLHHKLEGDFTRDLFVLQTETQAEQVTLRFAGIPYLNRTRLDVKSDIEADMRNKKFTFKETGVRLNDLQLGFSGQLAKAGENLALDIRFQAPSHEFRHFLSLVPTIYAKDFQTLQTSGAVGVEGHVSGQYGPNGFPAFAVRAKVVNGQFRYPDLPLPGRNINLDLAIENAGRSMDSTVVNLRRFHAVLGNDPIDASMVLRTPVSDPEVKLNVAGQVDLANLKRTVKLERVNELAGTVAANVSVHTRMSSIDAKRYDRITATGTAALANVTVRSPDFPHPVAIQELKLDLSPRVAQLHSFKGTIGSSDLHLVGTVENLLGFVLRDQDLSGTATLNSRLFDLNEWRSGKDSLAVIPVPPRIDFALTTGIDRLKFGRLEMTDTRGKVRLQNQRITLEDLAMKTLGGTLGLRGYYETLRPDKPTFEVDLAIKEFNIPDAFRALTTVQMLAPVARYAQGTFSTELRLNGALSQKMMPLFEVLTGRGLLRTSTLVLQDFPGMNRLAEALKLQQLKNPTLAATRSSIEIRDGKLFVKPFDVQLGSSTMTVSGWNGIDHSLDYTLALAIPRAALGTEANRLVNDWITKAGSAGLALRTADVVNLGVRLTGSITNPTIKTDLVNTMASAKTAITDAAKQAVDVKAAEVKVRVDSAKLEARRKALAEAERLIRAAEERAAAVRTEAAQLAEKVKKEAELRADSAVARATTPIARTAARALADRARKEAANRADQIVREANKRADDMVAEARRKGALTGDTVTTSVRATTPGVLLRDTSRPDTTHGY
jgi:AsmA-like protein